MCRLKFKMDSSTTSKFGSKSTPSKSKSTSLKDKNRIKFLPFFNSNNTHSEKDSKNINSNLNSNSNISQDKNLKVKLTFNNSLDNNNNNNNNKKKQPATLTSASSFLDSKTDFTLFQIANKSSPCNTVDSVERDSTKLSSSLTLPSSNNNNNKNIINNSTSTTTTNNKQASNSFSINNISIHSNSKLNADTTTTLTLNNNTKATNTSTTTTTSTKINNNNNNDNNELNLNYSNKNTCSSLSKSLSTNSTPSKILVNERNPLQRLSILDSNINYNNTICSSFNAAAQQTCHRIGNKQANSFSSSALSTYLHYPFLAYRTDKANNDSKQNSSEEINLNYNSKPKCSASTTIIASSLSRSLSHQPQSPDCLANMTLSNPNSQNKPFLNETNTESNANTNNTNSREFLSSNRQLAVSEAPKQQTNKFINDTNMIALSSASSAASSSSSPPTFNQTNTSTPSSHHSTSPCNQNNQLAQTVSPQPTYRFTIKKVLDSELLNNSSTSTVVTPTIHSTPVEPTCVETSYQVSQPQQQTLTDTTDLKINNSALERRVSKFTVKKVDSTELIFNNNLLNQYNLVEIQKPDPLTLGEDEKASNLSQQINNTIQAPNQQSVVISELNSGKVQQSQQQQSQQEIKMNQTGADQQEKDTRSSSIMERSENIENERERDADILEDEKPIDESPDKRFLKYDNQIGHGSFKTVYKGLDTESGVPVAWCELHDRKFAKSERQRFIEEAKMLKQLQHPNIVRFYDYWEDMKAKPKKIILVTELMTSGTLKAYVQRFKKQDKSKRLKVIKNFASQILKGLAYLHSRTPPVIHRDLKCDNVFVTGQCGQVKIGDLGLATLKKASFAKSVIGTPEFMAPEMYSEQYDESIDVYAFGMCLLEMATGEYPYQECTKPFEIYKRVTKGIKPDNYNRIDNEDLRELIDLCIRLNRKQRPSVKELLNHSWFMENNGLKLELLRDKQTNYIIQKPEGIITFRLKIIEKAKRKSNWPVWPDNEEIEFTFDVKNDEPEQIVKELKEKTNKISDEDIRYLTQAIKDKCCVFRLEKDDRLEDENQNKTNNATTNSNNTSNLSNTTSTGTGTINNPSTNTGQNGNPNMIMNPSIPSSIIEPAQLGEINAQNAVQAAQVSVNLLSQISTYNGQMQPGDLNNSKQQTNILNEQMLIQKETTILNGTVDQTQQQQNIAYQNLYYQQQQQQSQPVNIINQQQQQQKQPVDLANSVFVQAPKQVQFMEPSIEQNKLIVKTEIPIKLTITDVIESIETGDVVHCSLELDDKEKINFKFGLNADSPQEIASRLLNVSNKIISNEHASSLNDFFQTIIQRISMNKQSLVNIKNKQFTSVLVPSKQKTVEHEKLNLNDTSTNQQLITVNPVNQTLIQQQQQQQQQAPQQPQQQQIQPQTQPAQAQNQPQNIQLNIAQVQLAPQQQQQPAPQQQYQAQPTQPQKIQQQPAPTQIPQPQPQAQPQPVQQHQQHQQQQPLPQPQPQQQIILNQSSNLNSLKSNSQINIYQPAANINPSNNQIDLLKSLQQKQQQINAEIQQIRMEMKIPTLTGAQQQPVQQQTTPAQAQLNQANNLKPAPQQQQQQPPQPQQQQAQIQNKINPNQFNINTNQTQTHPILNSSSFNYNNNNNTNTNPKPNQIYMQQQQQTPQPTNFPLTNEYEIPKQPQQIQQQQQQIQYSNNLVSNNALNQNQYFNQVFQKQAQSTATPPPPSQASYIIPNNYNTKLASSITPLQLQPIQGPISNGPQTAPIVASSSKLTSPSNLINKQADNIYTAPIQLSSNNQIATHQMQQLFQQQAYLQNDEQIYLLNSSQQQNNLASSSSSSIIGSNHPADQSVLSTSYPTNSNVLLDIDTPQPLLNQFTHSVTQPTYASIVSNTANTNPIAENVAQVQHIPRKTSINVPDPYVNNSGGLVSLNDTVLTEQAELVNLNLEESKILPTTTMPVHQILNIKQEQQQIQANNGLLELDERLKHVLSADKTLHGELTSTQPVIESIVHTHHLNDQILASNTPTATQQQQLNQTNFTNNHQAHQIHQHPHHSHLNESTPFSPSLSRRNSIDLKERLVSKQLASNLVLASNNLIEPPVSKTQPTQLYNQISYSGNDQTDSSAQLHNTNTNTSSTSTTTTTSNNNNNNNELGISVNQENLINSFANSNLLNCYNPAVLHPYLIALQQQQLQSLQAQLYNQNIFSGGHLQQQTVAQQPAISAPPQQQQASQAQVRTQQTQQPTQQTQSTNQAQPQQQQPQQQQQQQYLQHQPQQQQQLNNLGSEKYGNNLVENLQLAQNQRTSSLQANVVLNPNFILNLEELFIRQRREMEDLFKKHQSEFQDYLLDIKQALASQLSQTNKKD